MKMAGLNLWILSGDKMETVVNVAYSSTLINSNILIFTLDSSDYKNTKQKILDIHHLQKFKPNTQYAIAVSGLSLVEIERKQKLVSMFVKACINSQTVIGFRLLSSQKSILVKMIQYNFPKSSILAVGDGANDI